ncbi:MAG TPA: hypothetical protein VHF46_01830 [Rubrobacteraceae bacterium]|nr:hypothetical protein [Rubrobacteraceae bacterium]
MAERGFLVEELVYGLEVEGRGLTFEYCEGVIVGAIVPGSFGFVRRNGYPDLIKSYTELQTLF